MLWLRGCAVAVYLLLSWHGWSGHVVSPCLARNTLEGTFTGHKPELGLGGHTHGSRPFSWLTDFVRWFLGSLARLGESFEDRECALQAWHRLCQELL